MQTLIQRLRDARARRRLRLIDPAQQRFAFCPVWANYLDPPAPVQVDTTAGTLTVQAGITRSFLREYDIVEYSFPLSADEIVYFHPPQIFVAHYNEFSSLAARNMQAFLAVVPDGRVVAGNEWGAMQYDAYFFAPASDAEPYEPQQARVAGLRMGLKELWRDMIDFVEYIPRFSQRAAWETGEKLVKGEWFAIRLTLNIIDYELTRM